nr:DUF3592 domain-containing protein [Steroidobacteraceae bacterium]
MLAYRILSLAARLLLALGASCGLLGIYLVYQAQTFLDDSARATGEVVSYREVPDGDTTRYRPRFRFETADGSIVAVEGQLATTTERFAIGEKIPIVYPIANPQKARVALFVDNWLGASVSLGVGVLAFLAGIFIRRAATRDLAAKSVEPKK